LPSFSLVSNQSQKLFKFGSVWASSLPGTGLFNSYILHRMQYKKMAKSSGLQQYQGGLAL